MRAFGGLREFTLRYTHAIATEAATGNSEDRAAFVETAEALVIVVSDGAGGIAGGDIAADSAVSFIRSLVERNGAVSDPSFWSHALADLDGVLSRDSRAGECTVVVAVLDVRGVQGASVGDSGAPHDHK